MGTFKEYGWATVLYTWSQSRIQTLGGVPIAGTPASSMHWRVWVRSCATRRKDTGWQTTKVTIEVSYRKQNKIWLEVTTLLWANNSNCNLRTHAFPFLLLNQVFGGWKVSQYWEDPMFRAGAVVLCWMVRSEVCIQSLLVLVWLAATFPRTAKLSYGPR